MMYVKLTALRNVSEEIVRLEKESRNLHGCKKKSDKHLKKEKQCTEELKLCRALKARLEDEKLVESLGLDKRYRKMAKNFYYKGKNWHDAFLGSPLYDDIEKYEKKIEDAIRKKMRTQLRKKVRTQLRTKLRKRLRKKQQNM